LAGTEDRSSSLNPLANQYATLYLPTDVHYEMVRVVGEIDGMSTTRVSGGALVNRARWRPAGNPNCLDPAGARAANKMPPT